MEKHGNQIECPNCGHAIDVNDILFHQITEDVQKEFNDKLASERKAMQEKANALADKEKQIKENEAKFQEQLNNGIEAGIKSKQAEVEKALRLKLEAEQAEQMKSVQEELNEKNLQLKELNQTRIENERLKREKDEIKERIEMEAEKKLNEAIQLEKEKAQKLADEKNELKLKDRDNLIEQLKEQLTEAKRKAEQGSMQAQGESQELAIEEWLANEFPYDTIDEIKKGERGADCIQIVNTPHQQNCGSIYYESKRTKHFQPSWIEKFKEDIRDKNADIAVLVTEAMPADMDRAGLMEGIWICTYEEFKFLSGVLRQSLIKLSTAIATQENKGDKMNMLYDYLTSNEFKLQIEGIVEGFVQMQTDLESEKRSMMSIWKKREKQIEKVLHNTNFMYSSIKGIAGNAVPEVKLLELTDEEEQQGEEEN